VDTAADKDLGGDFQLQTAFGIVTGMCIFINLCVVITSVQNPIHCEACFIHQQQVYPAAAALHRTLFDAHNPATVSRVGTDTTADHVVSTPPFVGKYGDDGSTT
jgi:hypothetical protein